mmetsp:Transcript_21646/g.60166  ORF Transcript_21646/g.60166 Transcript_21646/m.60166 type:complete len:461 (-) Transcript_21646:335-1717(-)|eukprot:CAMPEP_0117674752 /NCGR_PEP_ID=MMETSP0804-20121206/15213_1 /TAXON_ID=1074897 /ORGANISM="Tetraselmis astigmatica, Strain CCMP880" /LENGTH=460 /DNA_ID=CAMNT_0005483657 /DNA_START=334 /DNA_END=1716 /DNA_ORIENTATION=-
MVAFFVAWTDLVRTLEYTSFRLVLPRKDGYNAWEQRPWVLVWRSVQILPCLAICITLVAGQGYLAGGALAAYYWLAFTAGIVMVGQIVVEIAILNTRGARTTRAIMAWYDLFFDLVVYEILAFFLLIVVGLLVEFNPSGSGLELAQVVGIDDQVQVFIGSIPWLFTSLIVGVVLAGLLLSSAHHANDRLRDMYGRQTLLMSQERPELAVDAPASDPKRHEEEETGRLEGIETTGKGTTGGLDSSTADGCFIPFWDALLELVLHGLGAVMKGLNILVTDMNSWSYTSMSFCSRAAQALLAAYAIAISHLLLEVEDVFSIHLIHIAAWGVVLISSPVAVFEFARLVAPLYGFKESLPPTSKWAEYYTLSLIVYDVLWLNISNLACAFGFALTSTFCLADYQCQFISSMTVSMLGVACIFYFTAVQAWNAKEEIHAAKHSASKEDDLEPSSPANRKKQLGEPI